MAELASVRFFSRVNADVIDEVILLSESSSTSFALKRPLRQIRLVVTRLLVIRQTFTMGECLAADGTLMGGGGGKISLKTISEGRVLAKEMRTTNSRITESRQQQLESLIFYVLFFNDKGNNILNLSLNDGHYRTTTRISRLG